MYQIESTGVSAMWKLPLIVAVLVLGACGGDETADSTDAALVDTATTATVDIATTTTADNPEDDAQSQATEAPPEEPAAPGAAQIVLTIGEQTWQFPGAFCAFLNAPAGESDSEWNVSFVTDGAQVYVNHDSFQTDVSIADIQNGGDPTFSWEAVNDAVSVTVEGDKITATGTFTDGVEGNPPTEGSLTATCASWTQE